MTRSEFIARLHKLLEGDPEIKPPRQIFTGHIKSKIEGHRVDVREDHDDAM